MDIPVLPWSRRLLGTAVDEPNLGQKPKLGGVRALLPFPLYLPLVRFYLFASFFLFFFVLLVCKNPKRFLLFLLSLNLKKPKNMFPLLFSLLCFRVQLESVMIIISYIRSCK